MPSVDFDAVRKVATLERVLTMYGPKSGLWKRRTCRSYCPLGCSADGSCCALSIHLGLWYCHRCEVGGGGLEYYAAVSNFNLYDGAVAFCHEAGIPVPYLARSKVRQPRAPRNRNKTLAPGDGSEV